MRLTEFETNVSYCLKLTAVIIKITTCKPCVTYHRRIDGSRDLIVNERMESDDDVALSHSNINIIENESLVNK